MGGGSFDQKAWDSYSSVAQTKTQQQTFKSRSIHTTGDARTSLNPHDIIVRESRDGPDHPDSTPIIIGFDETGSMGFIPDYFVKEGLGILFKEIYDRKPVHDPQILCMALGDAYTDTAPIQVTQFESTNVITDQLTNFYLEGNGGGNGGESYCLAHYFAGTKTSCDRFEKRGKKGLLFTIGDEFPHGVQNERGLKLLTIDQIKRFIGGEPTRDLTAAECVAIASPQWDIFHIIAMEGSGSGSSVQDNHGVQAWTSLLGEGHVIKLNDHTKLSEVIVSAIQIWAGADYDAVVKSWSGSTNVAVSAAISRSLAASKAGDSTVVRI